MIRSFALRLIPVAVLMLFLNIAIYAVDGSDTTKHDSIPILLKQYLGVSGTSLLNQRTVGLPEQYAAQIGNTPLLSLAISSIYWGDLLLRNNNIRLQISLEKFLNAYPSPKLFENFRAGMELGYAVLETPSLKVYPFLGYSQSLFNVDSLARVFLLNANAGVGVDYFLPRTPLLFSLQASYNHAWNGRAAADAPSSNQPGLAVRANVVVLLQTRRNYWGWE